MNVLMIGVDETSIGGMLTVVNNYKNNKEFCKMTNLKYVATVIRSNKLVKIKTFLCKIPEIISTIRNDKIDIVHVHMAERGSVFREGFVVLLANVMGCKTVIHMHGADIEDWYNKQFVLIKKLIANIFCAADVMIVLGDNWLPFMRSVMVGHEEKIKVLHNAVYVEAENKANVNATDILFYGMLIKRKGIEDLLAAFEKIKDDIPKNIHLRLCKAIMDRETTYPLSQCRNIKDIIKSLMWHKAMQKKYENFWSFIKENMKITKPYTRENVKELNNIFDVFIVGSDIVWGTNITGNDWTYFLDFADDSKTKIAFSSSIGTKWNSDVEKQILSNLNKFKSISVREELAQSWLREIGINADVTCDPTMLWDSSFWSRMVERPKTNEQPYVLVYMWTKDMRTVNHAKMYAKAHGWRKVLYGWLRAEEYSVR